MLDKNITLDKKGTALHVLCISSDLSLRLEKVAEGQLCFGH